MPQYKYSASNNVGKTVHGKVDAVDAIQLKQILLGQDQFLLEYTEILHEVRIPRLKANEISDFCRQIGSMLQSGITLVRAMDIILRRDLKKKELKLYSTINMQVRRGVELSDAMLSLGKAFPELLINMIRAGEESGKLDEICMKMADHYQNEHKTNSNIKGAMAYPAVLGVLTVVAVIIIFVKILPNFFKLFEGMELPIPTQIVIWVSKLFTERWYILVFVVLAIIIIYKILDSIDFVKLQLDKFKLKIPMIGKLMKTIYTARFCRTLSSLYTSGMPIVLALQTAKTTVGNRFVAFQFDDAIKKIQQGVSMSAALKEITGFDKKLYSTVLIGEESGKLDEMLISTADSFDYESEAAIRKLTGLIEPIMIIFMALIIGFVFVSVMMPIYALYQSIG